MPKIVFKIYVAGFCKRNDDTIATYKEACTEAFGNQRYEVTVIDILEEPSLAEKKKILATPTIIRETPEPEKRIIGELRDIEKAKKAITFLTEDFKQQTNGKKQKP
jgi:circadian clock protein KaiB